MSDVMTVVWKERRSLFRGLGVLKAMSVLLGPALFAIVFPITWGPDWVEEFPILIIAILVPAVLVAVLIPDSFAGERERHTLGTLLASRLPDRAILFGKMIVPVAVGWGAALSLALVSLIVVNIAHGKGQLLLYGPTIAVGIVALSFFVATSMAGAGVLASLRSATAQGASQKLMMFILAPAALAQILPLLFPEQFLHFMGTVDGPHLLLIVLAALFVIDLAVCMAALLSFRRSRLISLGR